MNQRTSLVLTVLVGVASGVAGSTLGNSWSRPKAEPTQVRQTPTVQVEKNATQGASDWLTAQRERRLARLEHMMNSAPEAAYDDDEDDAQTASPRTVERPRWKPTPLPDLEEVRERALSAWESQLSRIDQEPVDPSWARDKESALSSHIQSLAQRAGFRLLQAQCKTRSCSATMEWTSYADAMKHYSVVLHETSQSQCRRKIMLPEPENPSAPYQATIVLDCARERGS